MSKAEKFVQDYTRNCSNENGGWTDGDYVQIYHPWLTPDQALRAVEIAREETIKKVCEWLENNVTGYCVINDTYDVDGCIDDLKKAMRDE